ncbi:hypothetical protein Kisp02_32010 [Kineosporia sp. NBRC 101731]|nr:hypothetical protein Kisp02_32010 [Kineosporia sp. NBRC 101731]
MLRTIAVPTAFRPEVLAEVAHRLRPLRDRFGTDTADLVRVALGYALHSTPDAVVLTGFRNPDQITMNVGSLLQPLQPGELEEARSIIHPHVRP